jgi:hypothetical protein
VALRLWNMSSVSYRLSIGKYARTYRRSIGTPVWRIARPCDDEPRFARAMMFPCPPFSFRRVLSRGTKSRAVATPSCHPRGSRFPTRSCSTRWSRSRQRRNRCSDCSLST